MPDVSILLPDADAPTGYTVPSTSEIIPKAASAIIDGTSASGDFYPVLEVVSDGGHVVAQSRGSSVAAGGSVEQTWFPRVGAGSTVAPIWGTYYIDSVTIGGGGFSTSTWHFNSGTNLLTIVGGYTPTFNARGVYTITAWIQTVLASWATPAEAGGRLTVGNPTNFVQRQTGGQNALGEVEPFGIQLTAQVDAGETVDVTFENFDIVSHDFYSNQVLVQQIYAY